MEVAEFPPAADDGVKAVSVLEYLRNAIRSGKIPPGARLSQAQIAKQAGTSRIPVRDALQTLAGQGLVVMEPSGARVAQPSAKSIRELWQLRGLIESSMIPTIIENFSRADANQLRAIIEASDTLTDVSRIIQANYRFHSALYDIAGLPHAAAIARNIATLLGPQSALSLRDPEVHKKSQAEHRELLDALTEMDVARAQEIIVAHSERPKQELLDQLYDEQQLGF